jgi:hypothetical protein
MILRIAELGANSQFSRISAASTASTAMIAWCIELRLFPELPQRVNHGNALSHGNALATSTYYTGQRLKPLPLFDL